ncbi:transposase [Desulfatitalea tepidiphila]|uniref:transposase n=1 Tax=Desulfatitalea tepidiphila TaxID=1185843 RepID=UPI001F382191|nr:transposase [Desulfatitalea tepidiphila]
MAIKDNKTNAADAKSAAALQSQCYPFRTIPMRMVENDLNESRSVRDERGRENEGTENEGTSIHLLFYLLFIFHYTGKMPRKARIDAPGALHHIILRGIERRKIFYDDQDRDNFLDRLETVLTDTETPCFAWALMPNHVHLLLKTSATPIPTVMRRLLTGYAVSFNRRHHRHGQLFQNRYKSILCQEDLYFLQLVRYIHLNPFRARLVPDMKGLDYYAYAGHSTVMGNHDRPWQKTDFVLRYYDEKRSLARRAYREYVKNGIEDGRRPELVGGGLVRSAGGWTAVKALRKGTDRVKGDERILGDGKFVEAALTEAQENLERRYRLRANGCDFEWLVGRVAEQLVIAPEDVLAPGKYPQNVKARSLLCFWATRELGMKTVELAEKLNLSQPTVSQSVQRGQKIARQQGFCLIETQKQ